MPISPTLPPPPGRYVLLLRLDTPRTVRIGRRGELTLAPGMVAYAGSALGPGGRRARVGRHLRAEKRPHWHIDALTAAAPVVAVWAVESPVRLECAWAAALSAQPGSTIPARGFGASDCTCPAHLIRIAAPEAIPAALAATVPPEVLLYFPQSSVA